MGKVNHLGLLVILKIVIIGSHVGESCVCMPMHPQQHFCKADFVIRGKILPDLKVSPDSNDTEMKSHPNDTSTGTMRAYRVRIEKIFKGEVFKGYTTRSEIMLYREDETCGMPLKEGEVYVMTGHKIKGSYIVNMCDWVKIYSELTRKQRQGIRHLYRQYCKSCKIQPCFHVGCRVNTPNTCIWNVSGLMLNNNYLDCESEHSRCIKEGAGCKWYMPHTMKECLQRRAQMKHNRIP